MVLFYLVGISSLVTNTNSVLFCIVQHMSERFQNEFAKANILAFYWTKEELSAPFDHTSTPVYKSGLRLVSIEYRTIDCPYHSKWMADGKKGMLVLNTRITKV